MQISWKIWLCGVILPFVISALLVWLIHPLVVRIAKLKNIVDNPNARKLQKRPIPVLGGVAVFWGIVVGAGVESLFFNTYALFTCVVTMTMMLFVGIGDDILGLPAVGRLLIEFAMIVFVAIMDHTCINDFHGLLGIYDFSLWIALPLSCIAGAGIINSINMIDGVDGLSSGYCIMACLAFGVTFCLAFDGTMGIMCSLSAGALIPFFLHNLFGNKSKMFVGDGGTMMMGMLMSIFCMRMIYHGSLVQYTFTNMGVVAYSLSILSVPVFDTLRVMMGRIINGVSPFHPDRSHLHHLFLEIGFSHPVTTFIVLSLNLFNMLCWLLSYQLGADDTVQFLVVVLVGFFNTCGIYWIVRRLNHDHLIYRALHRLAIKSHVERGPVFLKIQKIVDRS